MFRHLLSYSCRQLFRTREVIFWTLLFPVLLATFMNMAFGKISDATEKMDTIQVALYEGKEEVALETTLQQLSQVKEGGKAFINVKKAESMERYAGEAGQGESTKTGGCHGADEIRDHWIYGKKDNRRKYGRYRILLLCYFCHDLSVCFLCRRRQDGTVTGGYLCSGNEAGGGTGI